MGGRNEVSKEWEGRGYETLGFRIKCGMIRQPWIPVCTGIRLCLN